MKAEDVKVGMPCWFFGEPNGRVLTPVFENSDGEPSVVIGATRGERIVHVRAVSAAPQPEYCAIYLNYAGRLEAGCWAEKKLSHGYEGYGHFVRDTPDSKLRWEPAE